MIVVDDVICILALDRFKFLRVNRFCEVLGRSAVTARAQKIKSAAGLAVAVVEIKVSVANGILESEKT